jgi:hypothetical protein
LHSMAVLPTLVDEVAWRGTGNLDGTERQQQFAGTIISVI